MPKQRPMIVWLIIVLVASWMTQPVIAVGGRSGSTSRDEEIPPASLADRIVAIVPGVYSIEEARLIEARTHIAEQLVALDVEPDRAMYQASKLTVDDLEVLLANPKMMQRAGEAGQLEKTVIVAVIVVAVIVVIGVAGSGSLSIH